jgi:hypothetical protein
MPGPIRYLTVQDVLWINLWATRTVNPYRFADLEEAVFCQYAYGDKDEVPSQAGRLLKGFVAKSPFDKGSDATAFITCLAFLRLNGWNLARTDVEGPAWWAKASGGTLTELLEDHSHHHPTVRSAVREIVADYPQTIESLGSEPVEIVADGAIH